MQKCVFKKMTHNQQTIYQFSVSEHELSPSNLLVRKIFYMLLDTWERQIHTFEVEYADFHLAKKWGLQESQEVLLRLGAQQAEIKEHKQGEHVMAHSFISPLTEDKREFFHALWDLSAFSQLHFRGKQKEVLFAVQNYGDFIQFIGDKGEEEVFFQRMEQARIPYDIKDTTLNK